MPSRMLVVHATNLLRRGFLAASARRQDDAGEPTAALYVSTRALRRALDFKQPELAVAVLDDDADVDGWPGELQAQAERLEPLLAAHGLCVVHASHAADVVASYTHAAVGEGYDVVVVGSDKRLAQLVGEQVWWYDAYKDVRYTPELVRKRFEVGPESVSEWLALVGDDDVLPGVKGLGKKGATTLIEDYGSVAAALSRADEVAGRVGKALRAAKDAVPAELERARLDTSRALPLPLEELAYRAPEPSGLQQLYESLSFWEMLVADSEPLDVTLCDSRDGLAAALSAFDNRPIALHALTEDPSPVRGALVGVALSQGDGHACYLPIAGKRALADAAELLAPLLRDETRAKVGHDVKSAVVALRRLGVETRGIVGDSACASHLHEPSNMAPHDLQLVARRVLHRALSDEDAVRGVGRSRKRWAAVDVGRAAEYAAQMADAAACTWRELEPTTDRALLDEYLALSETLVRMELKGIAVDDDDLQRAGADFEAIGGELEAQIFDIAGKQFNLGSTKQLGSVLYEDLELPIVKRTKTGWSTATDALERIEHAHPIVPLVIRWRMLRRLTDSWVTALRAAISDDGRVHSTVNPARSFSGRLVNSTPDLGRVPGATPEMERIRHAFAAPESTVLLSVDYVQLGLYVLAHLSKDPALVEPLSQGADMHTLTAAAVLELSTDAVGTDERQIGKVVNFATFAGQGASALALQLGVTAAEAKTIIARFDERYAVVRRFQDAQLELVRERGYITTIAGRRWSISGLGSRDQMARSYAERLARRATHEGSVADVSRRGLLCADQALRAAGLRSEPLLQVHDEVLFEVPEAELEQAAKLAADAMRAAYQLEVPLRVGVKAGPNWAELTPM